MRIPWRISMLMVLVAASTHAQRRDPFHAKRLVMVQQYVAREGIQNAEVLESMRMTPRHEFVSRDKRRLAYFDMAVPIGHGQTISPPYIVAFMTEALDPRPEDRVLEIGTGSGYQAAVLSPLVQDVYTIEIVRPLGQQAAETLRRLGYANVHPRIGDGFAGWADHAPFDKIIVTCSPENIPPALVEQLAEGGRMVIPVGQRFQQTMYRFTKVNQRLQREPLQATFFVPMTGSAEEQRQVRPDLSRPELVHGSFESTQEESDQPAGWYYVREGRVTLDPQAPDGQYVVTFTNNIPGRSAHALQSFGVDGRQVNRLQLNCWVRARNVRQGPQLDHRAQLLVEFYGDDRGPVGQVAIGPWLGSFGWRTQTQRIRVPAAARLAVVGIGLFGSTGEVAFDAVAVEPVSLPWDLLPTLDPPGLRLSILPSRRYITIRSIGRLQRTTYLRGDDYAREGFRAGDPMKSRDGKLSLEDLRRHVEADQIETVVAGFPDLYGRLVGKRFDARHFLDCVAQQGTHACDYLLTVDMEMNPVPGYQLANWDSGYGDVHLVLDVATLRKASWLEKTALVLCDVHGTATHAPVPEAPRSLLRSQVERASEMGFSAMAGSEVEYYIFNDSYRKAHRRGYAKLRPAADYIEDYHLLQGTGEETLNAAARHHLSRSGVPVECTKGEWGCGQHELNLRYAEIVEMADRHALYKHALKEIADALGISVTFMAKWSADQAGSSCHLHVSLWRDGRNAFAAAEEDSAGSDHFRWFLGGWMERAPELMAFYAPTVNSYKRFQSGSWAPTRMAWAMDNRTAGFRVVGQDQSLRIECRLPGADCNPYLAFAAALASGLHGIQQRIEPPDVFQGNAYEADQVSQVPGTLRDAIQRLQQSEFAREAFGEAVVQHYIHFFRTELAAFDRAVTDWERFRYFERI